MSHDELRELSGGYALGALSDADRRLFEAHLSTCPECAGEVREFFKEKVFRTVIPRNVRLAEAPSHGLPVTVYDAKSRGSEAYVSLAREFLNRDQASVLPETETPGDSI